MATDIRDPATAVPPLRHGDRLTRAEFERRWDAMPDVTRAELLDGPRVHQIPFLRGEGTLPLPTWGHR